MRTSSTPPGPDVGRSCARPSPRRSSCAGRAGNPAPFIFVPDDNEWTDCGRVSNGAYDPLERLAYLRTLFWQQPDSLGRKKIALDHQAGTYSEHSRFRVGPVLFVTLNLPGDDNNYGRRCEPRREFVERNPLGLAWLTESFALARREKLAGIVLMFQANPGFAHFSDNLPHRGFRDFLETLRQETLGFSGQVVAVHGDSHISRIDQPLRDLQPVPHCRDSSGHCQAGGGRYRLQRPGHQVRRARPMAELAWKFAQKA